MERCGYKWDAPRLPTSRPPDAANDSQDRERLDLTAPAAGRVAAGDLGAPGNSVCQSCGHALDHVPVEIDWELLERCPSCGAYAWIPAPIKAEAS